MCSVNDKSLNLNKSKQLITHAASKGAKFICLPECSAYMGIQRSETALIAEELSGPYITAICALAHELSVWISIGGFPEKIISTKTDKPDTQKDGQEPLKPSLSPVEKVYNSHILITPSGKIAYPVYRKLHLFNCPLVGLYESDSTGE